ncbi:ATP12 family chaperone protein [Natronohydrobacter thiooxidans]|jgi:chaperone required for assembly of F1-ATPase|uniref:ATP12 family chaperone protein n=1 Tax=Natronohydrobacter thiooxidans TaxID=87172 RepID=UPI0008FF5D30|nr:ATP12 family protein [Natronohydrobacter thiooxidans]
MSGWVKKRFWKDAEVTPCEGGFTVTLDGRALKTPAKSALIVPTAALAELIAEEWRAQREVIDPESMPATRAANSAIDKVRGQKSEVTGIITAYGDSDLVCYRAESPEALVAREAAAWDPLIDWCAHRYTMRPLVRIGVIHAPQPQALLSSLQADVERLTNFELTAFHDLVAMSGSLIIGLATLDRFAPPEALWDASRVDEEYQIEQWGSDEEAEKLTLARKASFLQAARFYFALQD